MENVKKMQTEKKMCPENDGICNKAVCSNTETITHLFRTKSNVVFYMFVEYMVWLCLLRVMHVRTTVNDYREYFFMYMSQYLSILTNVENVTIQWYCTIKSLAYHLRIYAHNIYGGLFTCIYTLHKIYIQSWYDNRHTHATY